MVNVLALPTALRDMRRYVEILGVLFNHGFGEAVHELKLDSLLEKGKSLVGVRKPASTESLPRAERIRLALQDLGPIFIKLGQIMSTRPDLVPIEWTKELKELQDNCPEIPFDLIRASLEAEFPAGLEKTFRSIDPHAVATASIAQVHKAVLRNGKRVLIKVVRPGIEPILAADLDILRTVAQMTEQKLTNLGFSPVKLVDEFDREIHKEIDLIHEGKATDRFREDFADTPAIVFPKIYWEATTKSVLAVEEIKGKLFSRITSADLPIHERRRLVTNGARAVFRQCLETGFFHADPHPGNLIALPKGNIAFIDCGMVGQLDADSMLQLAKLVQGVVTGELEPVLEVVSQLTDANPEKIEDRVFRSDVQGFISHFEHTSLGQLNMGALLEEFFQKLRRHGLKCPSDLVLLIKALTTIESVGKQLDPKFNMIKFAQPYIEALVARRSDFTALQRRAQRSIADYLELAENFPSQLALILKQLIRNRLAFNLEHRGLERLTTTIEHASRNIAFSLIVSAMLVGSSILVLADRGSRPGFSTLGVTGFIAACVLIVIRVYTNRRQKG